MAPAHVPSVHTTHRDTIHRHRSGSRVERPACGGRRAQRGQLVDYYLNPKGLTKQKQSMGSSRVFDEVWASGAPAGHPGDGGRGTVQGASGSAQFETFNGNISCTGNITCANLVGTATTKPWIGLFVNGSGTIIANVGQVPTSAITITIPASNA